MKEERKRREMMGLSRNGGGWRHLELRKRRRWKGKTVSYFLWWREEVIERVERISLGREKMRGRRRMEGGQTLLPFLSFSLHINVVSGAPFLESSEEIDD